MSVSRERAKAKAARNLAVRQTARYVPGSNFLVAESRLDEICREHRARRAGVDQDRGGVEGLAPRQIGEVAYISMLRDPDDNWIEISQRASLTGALPGR